MRVIRSDVIVRVRPPSVAGEIQVIPSADDCVAPTYRPAIIFQFPVTEHLKGNGDNELIVKWLFAGGWPREGRHTYLTREEAQDVLTGRLAGRDTALETRDAVIFLKIAQEGSDASGASTTEYIFTRYFSNEYTLAENSKPWLPVAELAGASDGDPVYLLDSKPAKGSSDLPTISLVDLRASVEAVAALLKQGEGIQDYKTCISWRLNNENEFARNSPDLQEPFTDEISSGLIQRIPMPDERGGLQRSLGIVNWYAEGPDAEYFQIQVTKRHPHSSRNDIYNDITYFQRYETTRPLPMGVYRFVPRHHDRDRWRLCNHIPFDDWIPWEVTAVAPASTLHEAFFDPVADGAAIAAGGPLGALNPATFTTADGAETTIRRIEWSPNKATITLANPPASLVGHHAEFIALDGSVALRLDFDDAASAATADALALTWQVCAQPWQPGDLLMLRITQTRFDSGNSATHPTGC